jgi:hypothetical protein
MLTLLNVCSTSQSNDLALPTTRGADPLDTRTGQALCTEAARHPAPCPIHPVGALMSLVVYLTLVCIVGALALFLDL